MGHALAVRLAHIGGDDQIGDGVAEGVFAAIAEADLGGGVEVDNATVCIDGDDAVECRLGDGPHAGMAGGEIVLRQPDALGGMLQGLGERLVFAQDAGGRRRNQRAGGQGGGDGFGVREVFERAAHNPGNSERCGDQHQPQQKGGSGCEDGRWRGGVEAQMDPAGGRDRANRGAQVARLADVSGTDLDAIIWCECAAGRATDCGKDLILPVGDDQPLNVRKAVEGFEGSVEAAGVVGCDAGSRQGGDVRGERLRLNALPGVCRAGFARVVERGGEHDRHTRQNAGEQQQAVLERVQAEEAGCVCEHRQ